MMQVSRIKPFTQLRKKTALLANPRRLHCVEDECAFALFVIIILVIAIIEIVMVTDGGTLY